MAGIHHKTRRNREAGQALVVTAISLVVLVGMLGLGIDMGVLRYEKRLQQTAADAAAIAGASDLRYNGGAGVVPAAQAAASTNGFDSDGDSNVSDCNAPNGKVGKVCVQVDSAGTTGGPLTGPHAGNANYVEVLVSAVHPTYFSRIFGKKTATVTARAVAGNVGNAGPNGTCLYALGLSAILGINLSQVINVEAGATLDANACGILANGSILGNVLGTVNGLVCTLLSSCTPPSMPTIPDPLAYLAQTPPPAGSCTAQSGNLTAGNVTLTPGNFCNGISISGNASVTFSPGVYTISGSSGLSFTGNGTVQGSGVMFYMSPTAGSVMWGTGGGETNLSAPTSSDASTGAVGGVLFWQDQSDTNPATINGNGTSSLNGTMYFPGTTVTFGGNGSVNAGIVVAGSLAVNIGLTLNLLGSAGLPPGSMNPVAAATLVE